MCTGSLVRAILATIGTACFLSYAARLALPALADPHPRAAPPLKPWSTVLGVAIWVASGVVGGLVVLHAHRRDTQARRASHRCGQCGYDLTGNVSGVCPECGTPVSARREAS
jgi:hypothetical protein